MAIRENRPIFSKRRSRAGLAPWMLLALLAVLVAAGLYVYDKRQTERIAQLQADLAKLRATVDGAAAARKAMEGVASKQIEITGGQLTALWRAIKSLQEKAGKLESDLQAQAAKDAQSGASAEARAAAMLKDIASIRVDMAALLKRVSALERRLPASVPAAEPKTEGKPPREAAPTTAPPKADTPKKDPGAGPKRAAPAD